MQVYMALALVVIFMIAHLAVRPFEEATPFTDSCTGLN